MPQLMRKVKNAATVAALLIAVSPLSAVVSHAAEKPIIPQNPYELMQPAGKSYLGNKGPNLQVHSPWLL